MNKVCKLILSTLLTLQISNSVVAFAEESAPKVLGSENGFTLYSDGYMTLDGDEYDPEDPNAGEMLDYLESIGEIFSVPEPLLHNVSDGCQTKIYARIDKSQQTMYVYLNCSKSARYVWKTSTGLTRGTPEYDTVPSGRFGGRGNQSGKYKGGCTVNGVRYGNMSYAVYLEEGRGNYAIHGGCEEAKLGEPRSHGCIRIARANALVFRNLVAKTVAKYGKNSVRIRITK